MEQLDESLINLWLRCGRQGHSCRTRFQADYKRLPLQEEIYNRPIYIWAYMYIFNQDFGSFRRGMSGDEGDACAVNNYDEFTGNYCN